MKNIHIIPTDKLSRLFYNVGGGLLYTSYKNHNGVNLYITSDEENPKAREWSLYQEKIHKCIEDIIGDEFKKIILTTDQDLIKDGVQAIDDEFLEWFVNNPSCEEVSINDWLDSNGNIAFDGSLRFQIILPTEEPKSDFCDNCGNNICCCVVRKQETLEEAVKKYSEKEYSTPKDLAMCIDFAKFGAQWQKEKMYSEEEVEQFIYYVMVGGLLTLKEWKES